jgi:hypothetical protein
VTVALLVVTGLLLEGRERPSLYEQLALYFRTVADEAEDWLRWRNR